MNNAPKALGNNMAGRAGCSSGQCHIQNHHQHKAAHIAEHATASPGLRDQLVSRDIEHGTGGKAEKPRHQGMHKPRDQYCTYTENRFHGSGEKAGGKGLGSAHAQLTQRQGNSGTLRQVLYAYAQTQRTGGSKTIAVSRQSKGKAHCHALWYVVQRYGAHKERGRRVKPATESLASGKYAVHQRKKNCPRSKAQRSRQPAGEQAGAFLLLHGGNKQAPDTGGSHAGLDTSYARIVDDMVYIANFFDKGVLADVDEAEFRSKGWDASARPVRRAIHFFDENNRVPKMRDALKAGNGNEYMRLMNESGRSSEKLLTNVYTSATGDTKLEEGLELSRSLLEGKGAWRVHGGGFAGCVQALMPEDYYSEYKAEMEKVFGSGKCRKVQLI